MATLLRESGCFDSPYVVTEAALKVRCGRIRLAMGYQVASITLKNGTRWNQVLIESGFVTRVRGAQAIPFAANEIAEIMVTHDKWDFESER